MLYVIAYQKYYVVFIVSKILIIAEHNHRLLCSCEIRTE